MHILRTFAVLVAFLAVCLPASAQTYGEITGSVTDSTGAVIAGATVTVANTATGVERTVQTNEVGNYNMPFLNPGTYDLTVEIEGFKSATRPGLIVQVGDVQRVNFAMEVGAVTETIEVVGGAPLLQTDSTALGTVIEQQRIVELPLNGRNYLQLVRLSPNVSAEMGSGGQANSRQGGERANQALSIGGQRQQYNRFTLDGVENTDPNFNTFVVRPSVDALQEFKVQTGVYSAEYGKATSQINVTTRSGSNEFHGSVFEFLRNDKIQARPWDPNMPETGPRDKNPFRRNQFGFTVGGPIVKNKLFFMANYEGLRERVQRVQRSTVADAAMRSGDFSGPAHLPIFDPQTIRQLPNGTFTADRFVNNQIPQDRFAQPFVQMLEFYPEPNVPGAIAGVDSFNYLRNAPDPLDWDQFTTRIDFSESASSNWFGRLSWGDESLTDGNNFEFRDERINTKVWQAMLSNTRTFSPTLVNELRLGVNLFDNDKLTFFNGIRDVTSELNIPGLFSPIEAAWGTPEIGFTGNNEFAGWGEQTGGPFINRNRTYQIIDNVSWVRGNHTIKFGGEVTNRRYNQIGNQFPRGFFQFPSQYTGDPSDLANTGAAFATGLLGWTSEATRAVGIANVQFRSTAWNGYIEDSWKVTPTLTFNMGVRYEYTPPWSDAHRGVMNVKMFCPGVDDTGIDEDCPTPVLVRPGAGDFHEDLRFHIGDIVPKETGDDALFNHATIAKDLNDWAPRLGLAWQVTPKTTVRTGYGIYYSQDTGNPVFDLGRNFGARESARSVDTFPTANLDSPWAQKVGGGVECSNWDGPCFAGLYTFANDARRRTPYVQQYMLNVQRQVTDTMLFEAGYMGNVGHKLQRMYGFNMAVPRSDPLDQSTLDDRRPWPGVYGRIQTIANVVNSNYNALGVKVQQRYSSGLTYLLGYTWSRSIDNGSAIRTNDGDNLFPAQSYDLTLERGLSQFHTGQRFTASILYDIPLRFESRLMEAIAGGWQVGSIITLSDGTPFNGGSCGDLDGNTQGNRGDATGISPFRDDPTRTQFFAKNPSLTNGSFAAAISCVVPNAQGLNELTARQGNINRNMYIGPGVVNWDFSLMKDFAFTEGTRLEFRFESFNFANHPNWNNPNTTLTSANYGVINSARDMRTNQFALKFIF